VAGHLRATLLGGLAEHEDPDADGQLRVLDRAVGTEVYRLLLGTQGLLQESNGGFGVLVAQSGEQIGFTASSSRVRGLPTVEAARRPGLKIWELEARLCVGVAGQLTVGQAGEATGRPSGALAPRHRASCSATLRRARRSPATNYSSESPLPLGTSRSASSSAKPSEEPPLPMFSRSERSGSSPEAKPPSDSPSVRPSSAARSS
jgi:hypothetical protein